MRTRNGSRRTRLKSMRKSCRAGARPARWRSRPPAVSPCSRTCRCGRNHPRSCAVAWRPANAGMNGRRPRWLNTSAATGCTASGRRAMLRYNRHVHPLRQPQSPVPLTSQAHVIKTRMPSPPPATDVLLKTVHAAVEELKAKDVVEIDVRGKSSVTDYMVIASGTSTRHVKSIADEVVKFAKNLDVMPLGVEGEREAEWVLVDLGDVVVHVMLPRVREFYALERLWTVGDQPPREFEDEVETDAEQRLMRG